MYTYYKLRVFTQGRPRSLGALICGVRTYPNLSQLLPILGTKHVRDNTVGTSCFLAVFRVCTAADTANASCIWRFCTDWCGYCKYTSSFSSVGIINSVRTASTHSTEILSICSVILGVWGILRPSVHRVDNAQAHCSAQITHRWFGERELEEIITFAKDNSNT